jgi:hypothetical protein
MLPNNSTAGPGVHFLFQELQGSFGASNATALSRGKPDKDIFRFPLPKSFVVLRNIVLKCLPLDHHLIAVVFDSFDPPIFVSRISEVYSEE